MSLLDLQVGRLSADHKLKFDIDPSLETVQSLKERLEPLCSMPPATIILVHGDQILEDERKTLAEYGLVAPGPEDLVLLFKAEVAGAKTDEHTVVTKVRYNGPTMKTLCEIRYDDLGLPANVQAVVVDRVEATCKCQDQGWGNFGPTGPEVWWMTPSRHDGREEIRVGCAHIYDREHKDRAMSCDLRREAEGGSGQYPGILDRRSLAFAPGDSIQLRLVSVGWGGHSAESSHAALTLHFRWSMRMDAFEHAGKPVEQFDDEVNPEDGMRSASSVWDDLPPGQGHHQGRLDSKQAWSAKTNDTNQWYEIDLGERKMIAGVVLQGRGTDCMDQFIRSFSLQVDSQPVDNGEVYEGFAVQPREDLRKRILFSRPLEGQKLRLRPLAWNNHISLRLGVITQTG